MIKTDINNNDTELEKKIRNIISQTNYNEENARKKLSEFNNDYIRVIRDYMGIPEKKENKQIKSINQEIYKQIRGNLDQTMREYREKNPINIEQVVTNLQESDQRQNIKDNK